MLTKRPLADGNTEVEFRMPASEWITTLSLLGDFNQWNGEAHPMTRDDDGSWTLTLTLAPGAYRFRYFANGETWANDDAADAYVPNEYGSENSLVQVGPTPGTDSDAAPTVVKKTRAKARTEGDAPAPKAKRAPAKSRTDGAAPKAKRTSRKKTE